MNPDTVLDVRGVRKAFGAREVLHGIDLDVAAGEIVAVLGPSGCGKTTLLRIASGIEKPSADMPQRWTQYWYMDGYPAGA